MEVTGLFHAGITVQEMDRALRFYRDGLGLELALDQVVDAPYLQDLLDLEFEKVRVAYLRLPGGGLVELLEYAGLERMSAQARPCDFGSGHLALYVDDVVAMAARLRSQGYRGRSDAPVTHTAGPNAGALSCYMLDPDGYSIELVQKPPTR